MELVDGVKQLIEVDIGDRIVMLTAEIAVVSDTRPMGQGSFNQW